MGWSVSTQRTRTTRLTLQSTVPLLLSCTSVVPLLLVREQEEPERASVVALVQLKRAALLQALEALNTLLLAQQEAV